VAAIQSRKRWPPWRRYGLSERRLFPCISFIYYVFRVGVCSVLRFSSCPLSSGNSGKTIQIISFLSAIMKKDGIATDRRRRKKYVSQLQDGEAWKKRRELPPANARWPTCLIIAPSTVVHNWEREFETVCVTSHQRGSDLSCLWRLVGLF